MRTDVHVVAACLMTAVFVSARAKLLGSVQELVEIISPGPLEASGAGCRIRMQDGLDGDESTDAG